MCFVSQKDAQVLKLAWHSKPNRSPAQRGRFEQEEQQNELALTWLKKSEQAICYLLRRWRSGWNSNPRAVARKLILRGVKRENPLYSPTKLHKLFHKILKIWNFCILLLVPISSSIVHFYVLAPFRLHWHRNHTSRNAIISRSTMRFISHKLSVDLYGTLARFAFLIGARP